MRNLLAITGLLMVLSGGCAADAGAPEEASDDLRSFEMADGEHPEVGRTEQFDGSKTTICTATLVGPQTVITASHCAVVPTGGTNTCQGSFFVDISGQGGSRAAWRKAAYHTCARLRVPGSIPGEKDIAILHLDTPITGVTPATIASAVPSSGDRTIYGYGRFGRKCAESLDYHKRKLTIAAARRVFATVTCPGDSGGPHFVFGTSSIMAVTSGDLLVQVTGDVAGYHAWVTGRIQESEAGRPFTQDAVTQ
ncbi:MAG: trypsin-like serine protease [Polyangiaceae bacterium]|nr:trypsin-like serine protease [Polyangiaceae bacterium]